MQSIVSYPDRGPYGKNSYRGNCSGLLIKDLIQQYHIKSLSDYMVGGGTTEDVCKEMKIPGTFLDLNRGFDMVDMDMPDRPQNIFWHPPCDNIVIYSGLQYSDKAVLEKYGIDPKKNDLSRCPDWHTFIKKLNHCMLKQFAALEKGRDHRMFILMGDIKKQGVLYSMLCDIAKPGTIEQVIIKTQHNCWSDRQTYSNNNFVPIVHEYLLVLRKDEGLMVPVSYGSRTVLDMTRSQSASWRDSVFAFLQKNGECSLDDLYEAFKSSPKVRSNPNWQAKIRQTVQNSRYFTRTLRGHYVAAA
jgi:hypothetical protein